MPAARALARRRPVRARSPAAPARVPRRRSSRRKGRKTRTRSWRPGRGPGRVL